MSRKYFHNKNFFSKPNLLNSYWAGFIAADGCIHDKQQQQTTLSIHLAIKDVEILEKFKKDINFTGPISKYETDTRLTIICDKICSDLKKNFNITPRKSLTLKPPKGLTKGQALAFIIGYIDGDGNIGHYNNNHYTLQILGTENFLKWVHINFKGIIKNEKFKRIPIGKVVNYYVYKISNNKGYKILTALNKVKVPKLKRKWDKIGVLDGQETVG